MSPPSSILHLESRSPSFPRALNEIEGPPADIWVRGRAELASPTRLRIAIVGTRAPTPYGEAQAHRFGRELARSGIVIVSGLARGVDQAAHRGALDEDGDTIAVLGSGLERPWPAVPLVEEIASRGLLMSEHAPQVPPRRHHFPLRNRIISGLADGLLVVEAAAASGSLITAQWALDQGREVFALPGRVDQPMSSGCHRLLREGAGLVESPAELLELLYGCSPSTSRVPPESNSRSRIECALEGETLGTDELAQRLDLSVREILIRIVDLELRGLVTRAPGGLYRLT